MQIIKAPTSLEVVFSAVYGTGSMQGVNTCLTEITLLLSVCLRNLGGGCDVTAAAINRTAPKIADADRGSS